MDLERAFAAMGGSEPPAILLRANNPDRSRSMHPLARLRRSLIWNLIFSALVTISLTTLMLLIREGSILILLGTVLIFCLWATADAFRLLRNWPRAVSATNTLLAEMQHQHDSITQWIQLQMRVSLFVYPVAATAGFLLGGVIGADKEASAIMNDPRMWGILMVTLAILVPLCYALARWMFKLSFGKHLMELQQRIDDLRN